MAAVPVPPLEAAQVPVDCPPPVPLARPQALRGRLPRAMAMRVPAGATAGQARRVRALPSPPRRAPPAPVAPQHWEPAGQPASPASGQGRRCPHQRSPPRRHPAPRSAGGCAHGRILPTRHGARLLPHLDRPPVLERLARQDGATGRPWIGSRLRRLGCRPCRRQAACWGWRRPVAPRSTRDLSWCDRQSWPHPFAVWLVGGNVRQK